MSDLKPTAKSVELGMAQEGMSLLFKELEDPKMLARFVRRVKEASLAMRASSYCMDGEFSMLIEARKAELAGTAQKTKGLISVLGRAWGHLLSCKPEEQAIARIQLLNARQSVVDIILSVFAPKSVRQPHAGMPDMFELIYTVRIEQCFGDMATFAKAMLLAAEAGSYDAYLAIHFIWDYVKTDQGEAIRAVITDERFSQLQTRLGPDFSLGRFWDNQMRQGAAEERYTREYVERKERGYLDRVVAGNTLAGVPALGKHERARL